MGQGVATEEDRGGGATGCTSVCQAYRPGCNLQQAKLHPHAHTCLPRPLAARCHAPALLRSRGCTPCCSCTWRRARQSLLVVRVVVARGNKGSSQKAVKEMAAFLHERNHAKAVFITDATHACDAPSWCPGAAGHAPLAPRPNHAICHLHTRRRVLSTGPARACCTADHAPYNSLPHMQPGERAGAAQIAPTTPLQ